VTDENNPYAAPAAPVADPVSADPGVPAERTQRFSAALIDFAIALAYGLPLAWALGIYEYTYHTPRLPIPHNLLYINGAITLAIFLLIHGYWLSKYGQTVGKRVVRIRIVDMASGDKPPFARLVLLRYLVIGVLGYIPVVGGLVTLVDVLFIFRQDRRCIHDLICGTRVVKA
jgi:uncharacterized RDD family membrane protein YckC